MTVITAQLHKPLIHHLDKGGNTACYMLCQCIRCLIYRNKQKSIQAVLDCHGVTGHQTQLIAAVCLHTVHRHIGKRYRVGKVCILQNDQCGKKLRDTGRRILYMAVLSKDQCSGIHIHNGSRLSLYPCIIRPIRLCIGRHDKNLAERQYTA